MFVRISGLIFASSVLAGLLAVAALAHSGATGIVKERMDSMKSIGSSMKAISKLDWSQPEKARNELRNSAETIRGHAAHIVKQFPAGSIKGPSEAIPAIWEKPDEFKRLADALENRAGELAAIASRISSAEEAKSHMAGIGETCKTCHEGFRKKK